MSNMSCNNNTLTPWVGFRDLENHLDRIFHGVATPSGSGNWMPPMDIYETDDAYVLEADLPGVKKEDIGLQIIEDRLVLKGSRKREMDEANKGYQHYERAEGQFERSFRIRGGVDGDKVEARFENGVLTVQMPKPEAAKPRQIDVKLS